MFVKTTAIKKMAAMTARKRVIQGGTSAGKTYGIIPILINYAIRNPRARITVVAESIPAVKDGAVKIFKDVMQETGRWSDNSWIGNPMEYTFFNKSVIQFKSFDSVGKAKASGKREVLFINEANHIPYAIADALMIRSKETWIDFNPDNEFWVHTEILTEHNSEFLLLTYEDNEALPAETLEDILIKISKAFFDVKGNWKDPANIKSAYWANWCKVYVSGEIGSLQGTIFGFTIVQAIPLEADLIGYGLDWGFTNDPTALVALYKCNGELYIEELLYKTKLTNTMIADEMKVLKIPNYKRIVADSSEPKSITDLQNFGFPSVEAAKKGGDSIRNSIDTLQAYKINVPATSLNLIKELRNYKWLTDKTGKSLNEPVDKFNHLIDAIRYVALNCINEASGVYAFAD